MGDHGFFKKLNSYQDKVKDKFTIKMNEKKNHS